MTTRVVMRYLTVVMCLWNLLWVIPSQAATWYPFEAPDPKNTTALCTLLVGDNTWVGYAGAGLVEYNEFFQIKRRITMAEGLPSNTVTALAREDKTIWVGTSDGLFRISSSGSTKSLSTREGLPDNGITCLALEGRRLWAGTMKGLARLEGEMFNVLTEEQGLPHNHITALCPYPKGLLVGTTQGWAVVKGFAVADVHVREEKGLPFEWITGITYYQHREFRAEPGSSAADEIIVLGTAGGGLLKYRGKQYDPPLPTDAPYAPWITSVRYEPVLMDLWITSQSGVSVWSVPHGTWRHFNTANSGLTNDQVHGLDLRVHDNVVLDYELMNASGQPEIGGEPSSHCECATCIAMFRAQTPKPCPDCWTVPADLKPKKLHIYTTIVAIATQDQANLYFHKELPHVGQGNFYAYLSNKGYKVKGFGQGERLYAGVYPPGALDGFLFYFVPPKLDFWAFAAQPNQVRFTNAIRVLTCTHEGFPAAGGYEAGRGGVALLDPDTSIWSFIQSDHGLKDEHVTALRRVGNRLYIGTGGIGALSSGGIGTGGELYCWRDGKIETYPNTGIQTLAEQGKGSLFKSPVTAIVANDKMICVGTLRDGLFIWNGETWTHHHTFHALLHRQVNCLALYRGILYVGTEKGLSVLNEDGKFYHFVPTMHGLSCSEKVQALLWDDTEGDVDQLVLWLGMQDGFARISTSMNAMRHGCSAPAKNLTNFFWPVPLSAAKIIAYEWGGNPNQDIVDVCPFDPKMSGTNIFDLHIDDLNLWIATDQGITRFRK